MDPRFDLALLPLPRADSHHPHLANDRDRGSASVGWRGTWGGTLNGLLTRAVSLPLSASQALPAWGVGYEFVNVLVGRHHKDMVFQGGISRLLRITVT